MAIRISGLVSGLDTDSIVQELVSAYAKKKEDIEKKQTKLSWTMDAWKEMNNKIYGFYSGSLTDFKFMSDFSGMKKCSVSDSTKASVTAGSGVTNGTQTLKVKQLATAGYLTGSALKGKEGSYNGSTKLSDLGITSKTDLKFTMGSETKTVSISGNMTLSEMSKAFKEQGINMNFDTDQQRIFLNSQESGKDYDFKFIGGQDDVLGKLGLSEASGAVKLDASNAIIELNGAEFEGSSNTFNINGMTITARGVSDSTMSITTENDVDAIYDKIRKFIGEYNTVMTAMDTAYNADAAKDYEPLTDDEKEKMTDKEIEKWEQKIKDSLLRRDSTLDSVSSAMRMAMSKSYTINGKVYNLASFGIKTQGYFVAAENEKNVYHIDGDSEDDSTKSNEDRLKAAIAADPDTVAAFFNELASGVYEALDTKMKSNRTLSSAYKVYNDKQMQEEYDDYTEQIKKWEDKLKEMEDYYYDKFSQMESALSTLNSQQSQLSSLLGN